MIDFDVINEKNMDWYKHRQMAACIGELQGYDGKKNEIIFSKKSLLPANNVVFFGGDIQDYKHNMNEYSSWDLENTASIINDRFPESNVIVVKPKQMYENTYARYKNFVTCDKNGVPSHSSGQHSWQHLKSLLSSCCSKMVQNQFEKILTVDQLNSLPLILVGFSKGCVVLNQLLYDLPDASDEIFSFVGNVEKMIWLDGGHSGPSNTWINDNSVLEKAVKSGIKFETHVTPYQVKDKNRPWIGKEYAEFVRILKGLGAEVEDKLHFEKNPVSLSGHFSLLISF